MGTMARLGMCGTVAWISVGAAQAQGLVPMAIGATMSSMAANARESACMRGDPLKEAEVAEARTPAEALMADYFGAAQAGRPRSAAFHMDGHIRLTVAGRPVDPASMDASADPLARPGNNLIPGALRFFRSNGDNLALGQWAVRSGDGTTGGVYTGLFVRRLGRWKLRELTVSPAGERVEPVAPLCHAPGDVVRYNLESAKLMRDTAEKRVSRAEARAAAAERTAQASKARAQAHPGGSWGERASADRADAAQLTDELAKRRSALTDAQREAATAEQAAADLARGTVDAQDGMTLASTPDPLQPSR